MALQPAHQHFGAAEPYARDRPPPSRPARPHHRHQFTEGAHILTAQRRRQPRPKPPADRVIRHGNWFRQVRRLYQDGERLDRDRTATPRVLEDVRESRIMSDRAFDQLVTHVDQKSFQSLLHLRAVVLVVKVSDTLNRHFLNKSAQSRVIGPVIGDRRDHDISILCHLFACVRRVVGGSWNSGTGRALHRSALLHHQAQHQPPEIDAVWSLDQALVGQAVGHNIAQIRS